MSVVMDGSEGFDRIYDEMTYGPGWANGLVPRAILAIWAVTVVAERPAGRATRAELSTRVGIVAVFSGVVALVVAAAGFGFTTMVASLNSDWLPYVLPADHLRQFAEYSLITVWVCVASALIGSVVRHRGSAIAVAIGWPIVWYWLVITFTEPYTKRHEFVSDLALPLQIGCTIALLIAAMLSARKPKNQPGSQQSSVN
ncbi:hypothetical protein [Kribbella sp. DT2]|uniref:hypothetical protein n=1 Tax=Kribbella sp. DT2 TaxID=3393427 RepID=UPI003CF2F67B